MAIGMSVPGMSAAGTTLGLGGYGGDALNQQLKDESDEDRKKRLALAAQNKAMGPAGLSLGLGY